VKVICIDENPRCTDMNVHITKGRIYDVTPIPPTEIHEVHSYANYSLVNDVGRLIFVACDGFKPLDEYRNDKIEQIL
jgi:hypothetical protein